MAAPLPTGFSLSALPQAPNIGDPRLYAADPQGALATAHAGLLLGQELANIENQKAKRALEAEQIKLAAQQNKVQMQILQHTADMLPSTMAAGIQATFAESQARAAQAQKTKALADVQAQAPWIKAATDAEMSAFGAQSAQGALSSAQATFAAAPYNNPAQRSLLERGQTAALQAQAAGPAAMAEQQAAAQARGAASGTLQGQLKGLQDFEGPSGRPTEESALMRQRIMSQLTGTDQINGAIAAKTASYGLDPYDFRNDDGSFDFSAMQKATGEIERRKFAIQQGEALNPKQISALRNIYANADALQKSAENYKNAGWWGTGAVVGRVTNVWNNLVGADVGEAKSRAAGSALSIFGLTNALVDADLISAPQAKEIVATLPTNFGTTPDRYLGQLEQARKSLFDIVSQSAEANKARIHAAGADDIIKGIQAKLSTPVSGMSPRALSEARANAGTDAGASAAAPRKSVLLSPDGGLRKIAPANSRLTLKNDVWLPVGQPTPAGWVDVTGP